MDWAKSRRFTLTRASVLANAPEASGVYGLLTEGTWVYIGHASNIRKALLAYLSGRKLGVLEWQPTDFVFELIPLKNRIARQKELVARYQPTCNRRGSVRARRS